jgi:hypothetical protein
MEVDGISPETSKNVIIAGRDKIVPDSDSNSLWDIRI